jgi:hypothetical protein
VPAACFTVLRACQRHPNSTACRSLAQPRTPSLSTLARGSAPHLVLLQWVFLRGDARLQTRQVARACRRVERQLRHVGVAGEGSRTEGVAV